MHFVRLSRLLILSLLLALAGGAAMASGPTHIQVALEAESSRPMAGQDVALAIVMTPAPGWHGYWKNPGDAGVATRVIWSLPPGAEVGELSYPVPQTLMIAGLMNYVYEGRYAILTTVKVPAGLAPGTSFPIRAKLDWLACTDSVCVPETGEVATVLTVGDGAVANDRRAEFDRFRSALPRPLDSDARFALTGDKARIAVPLPQEIAIVSPYLFPATDGAIDYAAPQSITRNGNQLVIETKAGRSGGVPAIDGILRVGPDLGLAIHAVPGTVPPPGKPLTEEIPQQPAQLVTILVALLGAVVGGLLLNIMPCVFPILSLKAISLARAGESPSAARAEALAYTAGTLLVCLALGATLLGLRAGGHALGWAFQLQDPRVILLLLLLVSTIAFNLAGLFELPSIGGGWQIVGEGRARAFWTGALAAFVATPCTGPFMGAALGAALVLPAAASLAVFAGLGLGLALPFLLLGFVPALRARLPRPGPWMERMRHILALPMFATAIGLAWVLGRQAGVDAMAMGLIATLLLAFALWWTGARQRSGVPVGGIVLGIAIILCGALAWTLPVGAPRPSGDTSLLAAEPFSEARLDALRAAKQPVFVYFTADWCLTCKVNERATIDRQEVADAFRKHGVSVLVGDWTRGDAAIGRFLAAHGRSGVPLYLFYPAGGEVQTLPQILTPSLLVSLGG
jgi:DsbC/DsbD-like thiol-disulfide interchange protein/cytochrome c biogenesis protein CcdA